MATSSTLNHHHQPLTTQQFWDALLRHVDESKFDPLAKNQLLNLRLQWVQNNVDSVAAAGDDILQKGNSEKVGGDNSMISPAICGTLHLSSEYISIAIHAKCNWRIQFDEYCDDKSGESAPAQDMGENDAESDLTARRSSFQNEMYFRLGVSASFVSLKDYNTNIGESTTATCADAETNNPQNETTTSQKVDRKEKSANRKLRAGMIKRLQSVPLIRRLLVDDDKDASLSADGVLLCEALIQQNQKRSNLRKDEDTSGAVECEERVNVDSESVEGIRNAILTHCEDNLDVLELLLNMPYLPRGKFLKCGHECKDGPTSDTSVRKEENALKSLSERAFLRMLEDAMWDACEKEGEDEMLDDLMISNDRECEHHHDGLELQVLQVNKKKKC
ncbi:hypothetical protein HJC23_007555 [Cyclotella cryptica]|uniref:Uncharacterized protein n=1 Tax=Cyclotella cryptica TaxID=29204 RepID=A0ABD3QQY6_9STRA|eukprot:CCRYP_002807-RA/>CCRYP_002807-RA protein AED:0.02 eAED:-0.02 QI:0/-1/0/1/-1/1/1/0/388